MINPYESTSRVQGEPGFQPAAVNPLIYEESSFGRRAIRLAWVSAFCYPMLAVTTVHLYWFISLAALGHPPQIYRDDPSGFTGWLRIGYWICMSNLIVWPIGVLLGLNAAFVGERWAIKNRVWKTALPIIYSWQCGVVYVLLREDPWGVMGWLMD